MHQFTVTLRAASETADLERLWRDLETRAGAAFFLSWDWIGCWLRESGLSPFLLMVRQQDQVVALALLQPSHRRRHRLLGIDALMLHQAGDPALDDITIEHNNILADRTVAHAAKQACIAFLVRPDGNRLPWDELHLGGLSAPEEFRPIAEQAGLMLSYATDSRSWAVDLDDIRAEGAAYIDRLSANTRYQIRRSIRLYEKRGPLTVSTAATVAQAQADFTHMKELHQRYWTGRGFRGSFASPFFERFHRALLTACIPTGAVEIVRVSTGGEPLGYLYNFIHDGWVCAYQTGFIYEPDAKLKPGLVSHYLCINRHLEQGNRRYDFLAGGDRYKSSLARPGPDIATIVLQRPLLKLRIENAARSLKQGMFPRDLEPVRHAPNPVLTPPPAFPTPAFPTPAFPPQAGKVLVLGDDTRSFLAIARSLGRQGIEVHAAPANFQSVALRSRYIARRHFLPYWMQDGAEWRAAITALLQAEAFDLVIPCDETTLLPIQRCRDRLEPLTRLAIPSDPAITALFDKHNTRELARSLGIPVSPGRLPRPGETAQDVIAELGLPVVVKPRRSYSVDRLHARGKVLIVRDEAELARLLPSIDPRDTVYEGFRPGRGAGVSILASNGRVLQAFEHHRVRENVSGSYYRVSAPLTPALEACCAAIARALDYTGVAMFEFRLGPPSERAPDGEWVLLEVNARPWGSMPLPVALGVDFPALWYQLLVKGVEAPRRAYRTGIYGRNLLPDLWSTVRETSQAPGGVSGRLKLGASRLLELARGITGREVQDVLVRDDPLPGLLELRDAAEDMAVRIGKRVAAKRRLARQSAHAVRALRRALAANDRPPESSPGAPPKLLVVCQGNICRSPFAEALLRARAPGIEVASFGMLPLPGRPTPEFGIAAAAARGIDLRPHRSAHLTRADADAATAILIFDDINARAIQERYPGLRTPVLHLGSFAPDPIPAIPDPYGADLQTYAAVYGQIEASIAPLVLLLPPGALRIPAPPRPPDSPPPPTLEPAPATELNETAR